jgi:hypothetical protein
MAPPLFCSPILQTPAGGKQEETPLLLKVHHYRGFGEDVAHLDRDRALVGRGADQQPNAHDHMLGLGAWDLCVRGEGF